MLFLWIIHVLDKNATPFFLNEVTNNLNKTLNGPSMSLHGCSKKLKQDLEMSVKSPLNSLNLCGFWLNICMIPMKIGHSRR
jgi:hypothetical protein